MAHGKIETRWVRKGKKPPFPLGKYLFYSCQKACENHTLFEWCGPEIMFSITSTIGADESRKLNKMALSVGDLVDVRKMQQEDEGKAFVKFIGERAIEKKGEMVEETQWCLVFENVRPIKPFEWKYGKQGVGFVPDEFIHLLQ